MFVPCANILLKSPTLPSNIHYGLLYDIEENIRLRIAQSRFFRSLASTNARVKNEYDMHMYFIEVLRQVRNWLRARASMADHHTTIQMYASLRQLEIEAVQMASNIFDVFSELVDNENEQLLEEDGDGVESKGISSFPSDSLSGDSSPSDSKASIDEEFLSSLDHLEKPGRFDHYIILRCYIAEIEETKDFCNRLWQAYFRHEHTLCTVGVLTNAAYALLENRTQQYIFEASDMKAVPQIEKEKIARYGMLHNQVDVLKKLGVFDPDHDVQMTWDTYCLSQAHWQPCIDVVWSYWKLYEANESESLELLRKTDTPKPASQEMDPEDTQGLASRYRLKTEVADFLLREFLRYTVLAPNTQHLQPGEFRYIAGLSPTLSHGLCPTNVEDYLTVQFTSSLKSRKISSWVPLGLQILVNVHEVGSRDIGRPWDEYNSLNAYIQRHFFSLLHSDFEDYKQILMDKFIRPCEVDAVASAAANRRRNHRRKAKAKKAKTSEGDPGQIFEPAATTTPEPFVLFNNNPVLSGVQSYQLLGLVQYHGILLGSRRMAIQGAIQCFHILKHIGAVTSTWADAEYLIDVQGVRSIFGRPPPTTLETAAKCMWEYTNQNVRFKNPRTEKGFLGALNQWTSIPSEKPDKFRNLLQTTAQQIKADDQSIISTSGALNDPQPSWETEVPKTVRPRKRNKEQYQAYAATVHESGRDLHEQPTPRRILQELEKVMIKHEMHDYFDYLSMHRRCEKLVSGMIAIYMRYPSTRNTMPGQDPVQYTHEFLIHIPHMERCFTIWLTMLTRKQRTL
jgi:hypothetical protein